jgi:hypothetical protein
MQNIDPLADSDDEGLLDDHARLDYRGWSKEGLLSVSADNTLLERRLHVLDLLRPPSTPSRFPVSG